MSNELAVKALNQYRRRDIFPYLALRYYLESSVGRQNRWVKDVCTRLTTQNESFGYLRMYHFKDVAEDDFVHRDIYVPAPSEALAEVALITELAKHEVFKPKPYVYSYRLSSEKEKNGVFKPYFDGFRERHKSISDSCWKTENGLVLYTDIKKFYPSIASVDAVSAWKKACQQSELNQKYEQLGLKILENHKKVSEQDGTGKGLLTGPTFSHLIANLLLDRIDEEMNEISNGNYWRYVDDVVFVGTSEQVSSWRERLEEKFNELNLVLHDGDKDFQVSCEEWLEGEFDFDNAIGNEWVSLISDVKRFLLANPSKKNALQQSFQRNNIRIPIVDYSDAVKSSNYLQKFQDWMRKYKWATRSVKSITINGLLAQAKKCEESFSERLAELLAEDSSLSPYAEKRITPKLRYLSGRLLYLSSREYLGKISEILKNRPDMYLIAKTMEAVSSRDFTDVLSMGVNATHSAAQLVRAEGNEPVRVDGNIDLSPVSEQSLAVLAINGVQHNCEEIKTELMQLASSTGMKDLMKSKNSFIREFACLHGLSKPRHQCFLNSSFDRDEELALDVLNQLQKSSHC
ncbi:RNA-directed DNA polymerase [Pseudoalteromonas sp. McH1-7]|uniref:RNA-directed DNA polymerase n=1 Tax=Pseudoalteromonas sp. McH1-7 TaxID=2745574 RepID=UPI0015909F06|nr:RNA-directed DNA polymerase [Pseudoalteromonas sp. McH1-7]NUZ09279.1 RNA-directed DNA polymerase [Pseudoalteromonas sp. McH1-7]